MEAPAGPEEGINSVSSICFSCCTRFHVWQQRLEAVLNRPGFSRHLQALHYGNHGGVYERQAVFGTFIVNQDGVVYEKDLGPDTATAVATIDSFDPDASWMKVEEITVAE